MRPASSTTAYFLPLPRGSTNKLILYQVQQETKIPVWTPVDWRLCGGVVTSSQEPCLAGPLPVSLNGSMSRSQTPCLRWLTSAWACWLRGWDQSSISKRAFAFLFLFSCFVLWFWLSNVLLLFLLMEDREGPIRARSRSWLESQTWILDFGFWIWAWACNSQVDFVFVFALPIYHYYPNTSHPHIMHSCERPSHHAFVLEGVGCS